METLIAIDGRLKPKSKVGPSVGSRQKNKPEEHKHSRNELMLHWFRGGSDTYTIAEMMGWKESEVYNHLSKLRKGAA